jgi:hypothetical protein
MLKLCRPCRLEDASIRSSLFPATGRKQNFFKRKLLRAVHVMGPTLIALAFAGAANLAQAQGTISFSGAQTLMQTVETFAEYAGSVICLVGLIFAGISFMNGNIQRGVVGLFGAIFGAAVLGWGAGWISPLFGTATIYVWANAMCRCFRSKLRPRCPGRVSSPAC